MQSIETMFEEPPPSTAGMSADEKIHRWLELDNKMRTMADEKRAISSELIQQAAECRTSQNTVRLRSHDGAEVLVEFKRDWTCDSAELEVAKEILKDEAFGQLFNTTYTPRVRALRVFLNTVFTDEAAEVAKQIIKENCREIEKPAYVSRKK